MQVSRRKTGFSIFEVLIVAAVILIIGALIYVAVGPKARKQSTQPSPSPAVSIEEVKSEQSALDQDSEAEVDAALNELTADLNAL